ncbi:orotidine-5'-phosphate decarboxylase [Arcobacter sp. s6]|uniref:orotidine-5'-phosphate decarboxylase n=1 Tax=Arcobacter sp. s6 TaxID=3230363 RepID=UPI0034A04643
MNNAMKLCISLDLPSAKENLALVEQIKDFDVWLKVGFRTYIRDGKKFLEDLKAINPNFKIFLDLKLYDIPNTMADAAEEISNFGLVDMFNVHASSGVEAMSTVMNRIKDIPNKPLVLAVTALTSFDNDAFKAIYNEDINTKATQFAIDTYNSGVDGVVCSAYESFDIKNNTSKEFITLCPGIRPFGEDSGDQKRVADIPFAKENLVDFIVVGRPIYKSENPKLVVEEILKNI